MTDDVFQVTYGCENCGSTWDETYPPRTTVTDNVKMGGQVKSICDDAPLGHHEDCRVCETVCCPTCEMVDNVTIRNREPISEDEQ